MTVTNEEDELHEPIPNDPELPSVIVLPAHKLVGPEIDPAEDTGFTTIVLAVLSLPHVGVDTIYLMITLPAADAVKTPNEFIVAIEIFDDVHAPPRSPDEVKVIPVPTHKLSAPVIIPGLGSALICTLVEVEAIPQE